MLDEARALILDQIGLLSLQFRLFLDGKEIDITLEENGEVGETDLQVIIHIVGKSVFSKRIWGEGESYCPTTITDRMRLLQETVINGDELSSGVERQLATMPVNQKMARMALLN